MSYRFHLNTAGSKLLRLPSDRESFSVRERLRRTHRGSSLVVTKADPNMNPSHDVPRPMCDVRMSRNVIGSLCVSEGS
jgi:hypothetical protein